MSAPKSLLQAALARLTARVGSGLIETAAGLAVLAQDAPAKLQQEWQLFWQEVELEAERLERTEGSAGSPTAAAAWSPVGGPANSGDPQAQIDALRAQVAALARRLERPAS